VAESIKNLPADAALGREARPARFSNLRISLALDPGAGWHGGGHRLARSTRVIVGHPGGKLDDVRGQERGVVENVGDWFDRVAASVQRLATSA
jgi:hypothetical protein